MQLASIAMDGHLSCQYNTSNVWLIWKLVQNIKKFTKIKNQRNRKQWKQKLLLQKMVCQTHSVSLGSFKHDIRQLISDFSLFNFSRTLFPFIIFFFIHLEKNPLPIFFEYSDEIIMSTKEVSGNLFILFWWFSNFFCVRRLYFIRCWCCL